jgi:iron complex outermembrane receptor protein
MPLYHVYGKAVRSAKSEDLPDNATNICSGETMMRRRVVSILFLWILSTVNAQDTIQYSDTLAPVFVTSYSSISERTAYSIQSSSGNAGSYDLGNIMQRHSPVLINSYGASGAVATLSFRGTNDDHNIVLWNGIRINSPASGTADISLLSLAAADKILVIPSAQGAYIGSGSFGGVIDLRQNVFYKDSSIISLTTDMAQFHQYNAAGNFLYSNKRFYSKSSAWWQQANNDYAYIDKYNSNLKTINTHNEVQNHGLVTDFSYNISRNILLKSGVWVEKKYKEIPTMMGGGQQSSKAQQDKVLRTFVSLNIHKNLWGIALLSGYTFDNIHYTDKFFPTDTTFSVNSTIVAHKFQNNFEVQRQFYSFLSFKSGIRYEYHKVSTNNYYSDILRHQASIWASVFGTYKQWQYDFSLRQHLYDLGFYRPIISVEVSWTSLNNTLIYLQYSDKYRLPDYNELYWYPGGNRNLNPEKGNALETGIKRSFTKSHHTLRCQSNVYLLLVKDNIQWVPVSSTVWSPQNLKNTKHIGADISINYKYNKDKITVFGNIIYNYNISTIVKNNTYPQLEGHVMRYRPRHQFKLNLGFDYRFFFYRLYFQYISLRYTDDENNDYFALSPFPYMDMDIGFNFSHKRIGTSLNVFIKNVTQSRYEIIRSFAPPPIHLGLQILLHINTKK